MTASRLQASLAAAGAAPAGALSTTSSSSSPPLTRRLHPQAPRSSRPPLAHLTFSTNPLCTRAPPKHSTTEMRPAIWLPMLHEDALRSSERWGRRGASALCNQVFHVRDIFFAARARSAATNMYSERGRNATERREIANGRPNISPRNIFKSRTCIPLASGEHKWRLPC